MSMGTDHGTLVATLSTKHNLDQASPLVTQENACGIRIVRLTSAGSGMVPVVMCPLIGVAFSQAQAEPQSRPRRFRSQSALKRIRFAARCGRCGVISAMTSRITLI